MGGGWEQKFKVQSWSIKRQPGYMYLAANFSSLDGVPRCELFSREPAHFLQVGWLARLGANLLLGL